LKLSPLLAEYLYQQKQLTLKGIGTFILHDLDMEGGEHEKHGRKIRSGTIHFEQDTSAKEDEQLVAFIAENTGKMKSLVSADLSSHIELAKEFLNIGKPFLFDGIGTLSKTKSGVFEFQQHMPWVEKPGGGGQQQFGQPSSTEESFTEYEEMLSPKKRGTPASRKFLVAFVIITGIGLAIWGGYLVYTGTNRKPVKKDTAEKTSPPQTTPASTLDTNKVLPSDTTGIKNIEPVSGLTLYKYIVEESGRYRALTRYTDLVSWGIAVRMSTEDSVRFKLYFAIPSLPEDTARIRDSLGLLYTTRGRARVEK